MKFLTIAETHRENGDRHKLKGYLNSIMGRPHWAAFSYVKMLRNYECADWCERFLGGRA